MAHTPTDTQKKAAAAFVQYHNIKVKNGKATLYKAVGKNGLSSKSALHKTYHPKGSRSRMTEPYAVGVTLTAPDFRAEASCGNGLHLSPTTRMASGYGYGNPTRYFECEVDVDKIIPLSSKSADKCKVETLTVVAEVNYGGSRIPTTKPVAGSKWGRASWSKASNRSNGTVWDRGPEKDGIQALVRSMALGAPEVKLIKTKNLQKSYALS